MKMEKEMKYHTNTFPAIVHTLSTNRNILSIQLLWLGFERRSRKRIFMCLHMH